MKLSSVLLCMLAIAVASSSVDGASSHSHAAAAPAPSVDCNSLVLNLVSCLTYVSNGSTTTKPEQECCTGLKTVLSTDAECLCESFKNAAQSGVDLNITKALSLPAACKLHAPAASNCGLALPPSGAAPVALAPAASPTAGTGGVQAPAPSPGSSGSHGLSMPVGSLLVSILIALVSTL